MKNINIEAAVVRQALEALENYENFIDDAHILEGQWHWIDGASKAITALRQALEAAGTVEPVAWRGLTDEEVFKCLPPEEDEIAFARAIEAKLREKNGGAK